MLSYINILILLIQLAAHPVHLTITNIEYEENLKKFDISIRLFVDDFSTILQYKNNEEINLGKNNENPKIEEYITTYITNNLELTVNDKTIKAKSFKLTGRKIEDITLWLDFEVKYKNSINKIKIKNTLMTDLYRDQKNMLILTYKNDQSALEFSFKDTVKTITY
ncbi:MAG: hypothetical protein JXL97_12000 [Bacteroidales bacterium]|nr:hypothetical protein [Bacteroidales bacterium]